MSPRADRPKRRTFTAEYKAQILAEYETADHGERGAILPRGLYSAHITEWAQGIQGQATLDATHAAHPERFGNRRPQAPKLPHAAWINQPYRRPSYRPRNETFSDCLTSSESDIR